MKIALIVVFLSALCNAHMWLQTPLSRGGSTNIGGTTNPCNGVSSSTGGATSYYAGQAVTFQFRVNQHGPGPFSFNLLNADDTVNYTIASNLKYTVTAGSDGFNGFNLPVTIPNIPCTSCSVQLTGMAQSDGSSPWYNCANIKIVTQGQIHTALPSSISPTSGPTSGGNVVTVIGTNYPTTSSSTIVCAFNFAYVPGTWVNGSAIRCTVPPFNQPTTVVVEISLDNGNTFSATGAAQYSYTGTTYLPTISSITPSTASSGETITIKGTNFYSTAMDCKFTSTRVAATYVSSTEVQCVVPTFSAGTVVSIEVIVDSLSYSDSGASLQIVAGSGGSFAPKTQPIHFFVPLFLILSLVYAFF